MPGLKVSSVKLKVVCLTLGLVFLFVASAAALALLEPRSSGEQSLRNLSFFVDPQVKKFQTLEQRAKLLREPLDFMVWSEERVSLSLEYTQVLREMINVKPFDPDLWAELVYAQGEAKIEFSQQLWAMQRALHQNRWNLRNLSLITRPCIIDTALTSQSQGAELCAELLASLPASIPVDRLAKLMGVKSKSLLNALVKQDLRDLQGWSK